jgi:hypothetical protein
MKLRTRIANAVNGLLGRSYDAASGGQRWPASASMWAPARQQLMARHQLASRSNYLRQLTECRQHRRRMGRKPRR